MPLPWIMLFLALDLTWFLRNEMQWSRTRVRGNSEGWAFKVLRVGLIVGITFNPNNPCSIA